MDSSESPHQARLRANARDDQRALMGCLAVMPAIALASLPVVGLLSLFPFHKPTSNFVLGFYSAILTFVGYRLWSRSEQRTFRKSFGLLFMIASGSFAAMFLLLSASGFFGI